MVNLCCVKFYWDSALHKAATLKYVIHNAMAYDVHHNNMVTITLCVAACHEICVRSAL